MAGPKRLQHGGITAAVGAKAKVLAYRHLPGLELIPQHLHHKLLGLQRRQLPVERHQHQLADAQGLQQLQLLRRQIQAQAALAPQQLPGVGPETHHRGNRFRVQGTRGLWLGDGLDHPPVAPMQAIETAKGNGRGPEGVAGMMQGNQRH